MFSATIGTVSITLKFTKPAIQQAARALLNGNLVAFPTETVYGLGGNALDEKAIAKIYYVKARPKNHPLIVHISSEKNLDKWVREIPEYANQLAKSFWPGPMTLILPRSNLARDFITGGQDCVGVRVPDEKFAISLLKEFESQGGLGVAAPSANRFGKVSPTSTEDVKVELDRYLGAKDLILDGGMCQVGLESTIIDCRFQNPKILRPGAITREMIEEICSIKLETNQESEQVRVSGLLESHYAPKAKVFLTGNPSMGDGLIALSNFETPIGVIRLASPVDSFQYAQVLYRALRLADQKNIENVFVVPPTGGGISIAINDRLHKAAFNK
jgi:L-threonylcarbamoyladenylate synthase